MRAARTVSSGAVAAATDAAAGPSTAYCVAIAEAALLEWLVLQQLAATAAIARVAGALAAAAAIAKLAGAVAAACQRVIRRHHITAAARIRVG